MPALEYFLISEGVSVDQRTNRLSIFNVLESVDVIEFPISIPKAIAVVSLIKNDEDHDKDFQLLLKIHSPGEKKDFELRLNFVMKVERHRMIMSVENMRVKEPGVITYKVYLNDNLLATRTSKVSQLPAIEKEL